MNGPPLPHPVSAAARIIAAAIAVLGLSFAAGAAPNSEPWPRWEAHDPKSTTAVDHGAWDRFLQRNVTAGADGINRVGYGRTAPEDRAALDGYVEALAATPVSRLSRPEQLAYWINLYNALTVQLVHRHHPVASIRDIGISPGLFSIGPWGRKLTEVEGEKLSLDDIEHRILRPIWRDPRIHYAVNCAAVGCPNLQPAAFTAATTISLLDEAARAFVNHPRGVSFDGASLVVSSIYHWFKDDFGGTDEGVIAHLKTFAAPALRGRLETVSRIAGHDYDWRLNGTP